MTEKGWMYFGSYYKNLGNLANLSVSCLLSEVERDSKDEMKALQLLF